MELLIKLLASQLPTFVAVVFIAGTIWAQFLFMKKNMVTKQDLEVSLLKLQLQIQKEYVSKEQCEEFRLSRDKHNGAYKGAAHS